MIDKLLEAAKARQAQRGPNDERTFTDELERRVVKDAGTIDRLRVALQAVVDIEGAAFDAYDVNQGLIKCSNLAHDALNPGKET